MTTAAILCARTLVVASYILLSLLDLGPVFAQPAAKGEAENLVPPGGAAVDVPIHAGAVCILSFPEKMAASALSSSTDFEIKAWGDDGVAVRATGKTATATLALATITGAIKVNVTLRVVPAKQEALTLVRFKPASAQQAFDARVATEVAKGVAPCKAELAATKQGVDVLIRDRADGMIAERLLKRNEVVTLSAHERNDANVIAHVERAILLGDDGYLFFQIENRSNVPFRLARAQVSAEGKPLAGPTRLASTALDKDPAVIGVVPAGASARGVVVVRSASQVLGKSLALELSDLDGRGAIRITRGIALK